MNYNNRRIYFLFIIGVLTIMAAMTFAILTGNMPPIVAVSLGAIFGYLCGVAAGGVGR